MSLWRQFTRGLRVLGNRRAADREIADEVSHYLDEATAGFVGKGRPLDEARRAARLELGGTTPVRERVRGYGWENAVDTLLADLRYATRRLAGNPGFATVSILTLALGIGACTAMFSIVDAILLRALPYPHPEKLVRMWERAPDGHRMNLAGPNFDDFLSHNDTFANLAAYGFFRDAAHAGDRHSYGARRAAKRGIAAGGSRRRHWYSRIVCYRAAFVESPFRS